MINKTDYQPVEQFLKSLDYIRVIGRINKSIFDGEVVGWNVAASSAIRKSKTILRIEQEILQHDLPLTIHDEHGDYQTHFRIFLKNKTANNG